MGKREPQIILKMEERNVILELGHEGNSRPKSSGWGESRVFLEGDKLEVAVKTAAGCSRTCPRARDRRRTAPMLFSGRLKRRCSGGDTVTEAALQRRNAVTLSDRGGDYVGDEEADSLRLLIVVGACGPLVPVLRNHAEIVLARANRQSPKSAALPFPQGSHSLGRRRHGGLPASRGWCTQTVPKA